MGSGKDLFLRPRLRLFLSVDIIGSTALKQAGQIPASATGAEESRYAVGYQTWAAPIMAFYDFFDGVFKRHWDARLESMDLKDQFSDIQPELWKAVGDELIFTLELKHPALAIAAVAAICYAKAEYSEQKLQRHNPSLDLKASGWIAGFPVINSEVLIRTRLELPTDGQSALSSQTQLMADYYGPNPSASVVRDFIGPSIDTGFRVAGHSNSRKMAITVDLAYLLASRMALGGEAHVEVQIYYDGRKDLKGVLGGVPYPLLWVDASKLKPESSERKAKKRGPSLEFFEDELLGVKPCGATQLLDFCRMFIETTRKPHLQLPYIVGDENWNTQPPEHKERLHQLQQDVEAAMAGDKQRGVAFEQVGQEKSPETPPPAGSVQSVVSAMSRVLAKLDHEASREGHTSEPQQIPNDPAKK